jgi:hypothetical protein
VHAALCWLGRQESPDGGLFSHSSSRLGYPEVTGYLVPTLLEAGERALATRLTAWLLAVQRADGSYTSMDAEPYTFDTGQVLRGLLAMREQEPRARDAASRAAAYLRGRMRADGRDGFEPRYDGTISESIHLYVVPPLLEAARVFGDDDLAAAANACVDFYLESRDALRLDDLTHFLAYQLEALVDLGRDERARPVLDELEALQDVDGAVRARGGVDWVCTPGLAQLACCWYKTGRPEPADRALRWLERHQRRSGGFLGSYGADADYFPHVELPWATKYYLDAVRLRAASGSPGEPIAGTAELLAERSRRRDAGRRSPADPTDDVTERIRRNLVREWEIVLVNETRLGDRVLDAGDQTAAPALFLAAGGRRVTAVRAEHDDLDVLEQCARALTLDIELLQIDGIEPLPFEDGAFDCVWSNALTRHLDPAARSALLADWTRISTDRVIAVIPDAPPTPSRGPDTQAASVRAAFRAAGLDVERECSVGARQGSRVHVLVGRKRGRARSL